MGICSVWLFFPLFSFSSGSFTLKRGQPQAEVQSLRSLGSPAMLRPQPHLTFFQAPSPRRPPRRASHVRAQLILSPLLPLWAPSLKLLFSYAVSRSHPASSYQTHGDCVLDPQDTRPVLRADPRGEQVVAVVSFAVSWGFSKEWPAYHSEVIEGWWRWAWEQEVPIEIWVKFIYMVGGGVKPGLSPNPSSPIFFFFFSWVNVGV